MSHVTEEVFHRYISVKVRIKCKECLSNLKVVASNLLFDVFLKVSYALLNHFRLSLLVLAEL